MISNQYLIVYIQGGRGHARNMIFEKIRSSDSEYPIIIDQFYCDHTECHDKVSIYNSVD